MDCAGDEEAMVGYGRVVCVRDLFLCSFFVEWWVDGSNWNDVDDNFLASTPGYLNTYDHVLTNRYQKS